MEDCSCECKGVKSYTPVRIYNPSGLSSLSYRVGTHARFKKQMISEIASEPGLEKLTTRSDTDLSIALLDSWASIADVLAFYQERIANEGFLRTSTERRSVLELARSIGYELRPGVSASTYLAFKMDSSPTSPKTITIEAGTKVQSIPGKDEMPQVFETSAYILARQEWGEIKPLQKMRQDPAAALTKGRAIFEGIATKVRAGDGLLFIVDGAPAAFRTAKEVEIDAESKQTIVTFDPQNTTGTAISRSVPDDAIIDSDTNFTGKNLNEILAANIWTESGLEAKAELAGWSLDVIVDILNSLAKQKQETGDGIYAFRIKCGVFGHNAPMWNSLPPEMRYKYNFEGTPTREVSPPYPEKSNWDTGRPINKNTSNDYYDGKHGNLIYLDNTYPAILPESWITLKDYNKSSVFFVKETREDSLTEFSLTGKATGLVLKPSAMAGPAKIGDEFRTGQESPVHGVYAFARYTKGGAAPSPTREEMEIELELDENFPPINSTDRGAVWKLVKILGKIDDYDFRETTIYAQSEHLPLADTPVEEQTVHGRNLTLEKIVGWLRKGQPILVEGELADSHDTIKREIAFVKNVTHSMTTLLTTIELESDLAYTYRRTTVTINANVAEATHGETKEETIGSGDPSRRFQSFELKQRPLTFVQDSSPSGAKSTLEVKVDGVTWKEALSFEQLSKSDNAYVIRTDNDSITRVIFGDGTNGMLPPSGFENIKAKYRVGIGMDGLVDADRLTLLMKRPLGVKSVTNPLPATGAADPEKLDDARKNAPRTVLTLDR
ncbi:MAG TPA: YjzC family protein, partial [Nitrososphaera sp.]